ncbi:MAG: response regulator [Rhodospirillaceae bacterium]
MNRDPVSRSDGRKRVLIADDSNTVATYIKSSMEMLGFYDAEIVANGTDALNLIISKPYRLIILDHDMPGMKGLDIIRTLSNLKTRLSTPIMLVTGSVNGEMIEQIRNERLAVAAVIAKPFTLETFQQRVTTVIKGK